MVWVSADGINMGTYKFKLIFVTLISAAILVEIKSVKSALLKVKWNPNFQVIVYMP